MSKRKFDLPLWLVPGLAIILLGGAFILNEILKSKLLGPFARVALLLSFILCTLSSIVGAVVARLTASQQITKAEEELQEKFDNLATQIKKFQDESQKIIEQSKICQNCVNSLGLLINTIKQMMQGQFGESLITYENLKQIEGNVEENREIWVLTSALQLEGVELREVIRSNFKKGIKYKYLIPQEDKRLQQRMIELARKWQQDCGLSMEDAKEQIQCYLVPKHFAYMTVIVYDPYKEPPTVLVKFPTSEFYEKEKYPLIYRVDTKPKEAWEVFVHSLQEMIDDKRKCSLTERLTIDFSNYSIKSTGEVK